MVENESNVNAPCSARSLASFEDPYHVEGVLRCESSGGSSTYRDMNMVKDTLGTRDIPAAPAPITATDFID